MRSFLTLIFVSTLALAGAPETERQLLNEHAKQIVMLTDVNDYESGGTGFELTMPSGRVLTVSNAHVCLGSNTMMAMSEWGIRYPVRVIEISRETDLCLLEAIPGAHGLKVAEFMRDGYVFSIGHPRLRPTESTSGQLLDYEQINYESAMPMTVCEGGMYHRSVRWTNKRRRVVCLALIKSFNTTMIIDHGSSGSPTLNSDGDVIGVVFSMNSRNEANIISLADLVTFVKRY